MPSTLSILIVANRDDLIQKVLDSNYGLFGLVVTDPTDETVLYYTGKTYHRKSWQGHINPEDLQQIKKDEPYDLLTDPPPLGPAYEHASPRDDHVDRVADSGVRRQGRVLAICIMCVRTPRPSGMTSPLSYLLVFLNSQGRREAISTSL